MTEQNKAYIFASIAVLMWSTVATAFKIALRFVDYSQLLLLASLVSLIVLFFALLFQNKIKLLKSYSKKDYLQSMLLGFLNPFLYYLVLFKAYSILPAQEAQPLNYTWGIVVVLLSIPILKQKIKIRSIVAVILSFLGVLFISTQGNIFGLKFSNPYGVLLAVGSSLIWGTFWIFNIKDKRDEIAKLFLNFAFGFIFILIYTFIFSRFSVPEPLGITSVAYVGLFEMGITFIFWLKALKLSKTTAQVSNLIYISPFLSLIFINFVLGEKILLSSFIGLVFIISGVVLQQFQKNVKEHIIMDSESEF
ncbi:MAG: DMT family transporter [FCB group bacterium]|jgi:drug/metabolite transporter (DMT)-like permease